VGQGARLTPFLLALYVVAGVVSAQPPTWIVDGGCRDGQPHGRYELRAGNGELRVVGAFNHGKRTGSFIFWTASGSRVAHIPYDDDLRNGTLATWYEARTARAEPARRFESMWRQGARDGLTRTWYADGHRRSETDYERGRQVTSAGWTDTGIRLQERAARDIAERDAATADAYNAELEALVRTHLPHCD
jgi:hypothetical protein